MDTDGDCYLHDLMLIEVHDLSFFRLSDIVYHHRDESHVHMMWAYEGRPGLGHFPPVIRTSIADIGPDINPPRKIDVPQVPGIVELFGT